MTFLCLLVDSGRHDVLGFAQLQRIKHVGVKYTDNKLVYTSISYLETCIEDYRLRVLDYISNISVVLGTWLKIFVSRRPEYIANIEIHQVR